MALKGPNFGYGDNDGAPTRAKPVRTPGAIGGTKYRDFTGAKPDEFFSLGTSGSDISAKLTKESNRRRNGANGR
jgi:hypothetical protein